jgi:hypothetical protein
VEFVNKYLPTSRTKAVMMPAKKMYQKRVGDAVYGAEESSEKKAKKYSLQTRKGSSKARGTASL